MYKDIIFLMNIKFFYKSNLPFAEYFIKSLVVICFSLLLCCVCFADVNCQVGTDKQNNCDILNTFQLADFSNSLNFNHHCSKENLSPYWQSYALFENTADKKEKAVVVGKLDIGFIRGVQKIQGLRLIIEKLRMKDFSSWANHRLAFALQAVNTKNDQKAKGKFITQYYYVTKKRTGGTKDFQVSINGDLVWERFKEPEIEQSTSQDTVSESKAPCVDCQSQNKGIVKEIEKTKQIANEASKDKNKTVNTEHDEVVDHRGIKSYPYVFSQNIKALEKAHRLNFIIKNLDTGETISLAGPVIENLKERLQLKQPESKTLGFFDILNPFQEGGLWSVLGSAFRYGDCIYLRKQSKYELDQRFK